MEERATRRERRRRVARRVVVLIGCVFASLGVVVVTGLPGPGAMRRYSANELTSLRDHLNAEWREHHSGSIASVDWTRARVRVDGVVVWCQLVAIGADERKMTESPPSPPGNMSCPAIIRSHP